jgi:tetratricopeptide (TPR) repeat protein
VRVDEPRNYACRKFVMSASALKLPTVRLVIAVNFVMTLVVVTGAGARYAQNDPVTAAQVAATVARVKAAAPEEVGSLNAVSLGQRLLMEQRYGEAGDLFMALLEKWPREPEVLYGAALAAFNLGRLAEAEALARTAVEVSFSGAADRTVAKPVAVALDLQRADALVLLAVILGARGSDTEALKTVERAVALAPKYFDAQFTLGRALYTVGDSTAAVRAFRAALAIRPGDTRTLFFLATALEGAGDAEAALGAYRELVSQRPQAADGHLGLGVLLIKRGGMDVEKGIKELKVAVTIDPNLYEAQVTLGRALLTHNLAPESVAHLQRAAELAPNNPEPHYQLALAYRRLGLNDKAAEEAAIVKRIHTLRRKDGGPDGSAARPDP